MIEWFYELIASIVEFFTDEILSILSTDLSFFEQSVPISGDIFNIMLAAGIALLLGNLVFQAMKSMATGLGFEGEDPRTLFARSMVFGLLLFGSRQICYIGLGLAGQVITMLQIPTSISIPLPTESMFRMMGDASWLLSLIVGVVLTIQLVKLFLEIAERYVIVAVLTLLSPLAFSMGGSKSTMDIFKGWVRTFATMCLMMCLNIVFLKLLISAMRDIPDGAEVFPWLMLVVAVAKVGRKIDGIVARVGLNPVHTGDPLMHSRLPGMLSMLVFKRVAGSVGKAISSNSGKTSRGGASKGAGTGRISGGGVSRGTGMAGTLGNAASKPLGASGANASSAGTGAASAPLGASSGFSVPAPATASAGTASAGRGTGGSSSTVSGATGMGSGEGAAARTDHTPKRPPISPNAGGYTHNNHNTDTSHTTKGRPGTGASPMPPAREGGAGEKTAYSDKAISHGTSPRDGKTIIGNTSTTVTRTPSDSTTKSNPTVSKTNSAASAAERHSSHHSTERNTANGLDGKDISRRPVAPDGKDAASAQTAQPVQPPHTPPTSFMPSSGAPTTDASARQPGRPSGSGASANAIPRANTSQANMPQGNTPQARTPKTGNGAAPAPQALAPSVKSSAPSAASAIPSAPVAPSVPASSSSAARPNVVPQASPRAHKLPHGTGNSALHSNGTTPTQHSASGGDRGQVGQAGQASDLAPTQVPDHKRGTLARGKNQHKQRRHHGNGQHKNRNQRGRP